MTDQQTPSYIAMLADLFGIRLNLVAARLACETDFQEKIRTRAINAANNAIDTVRAILKAQRDENEDESAYDLYRFEQHLSELSFELGEYLDTDEATNEYKTSPNGPWTIVGCGSELPYASETDEDLGVIADIINKMKKYHTE